MQTVTATVDYVSLTNKGERTRTAKTELPLSTNMADHLLALADAEDYRLSEEGYKVALVSVVARFTVDNQGEYIFNFTTC